MSEDQTDKVQEAADSVLQMVEEVEASGDASVGGVRLERARAILHDWVDTVTAVIAVPAFGRVTLIHKNGQQSSVTTCELPFALSSPIDWKKSE